jgi:hypothetical protein
MTVTAEVKESLEREYNISFNVTSFYRRQIKKLEKKHLMDTGTFLERFETGKIGDDKDFFDWYSFHKLLTSWTKTQNTLRSFLK